MRAALRSVPDDPYRVMQFLPVPLMPAGIHVTMDTALQIAGVWACVDAISSALASCAWLVLTRDDRGRRKVLPEDPASYLLNVRPNPDMTAIAFREAILFMCLTYGNGYAEIVRDLANRPSAIWPLIPDRVTPRRLDKAQGYTLVYDYANPDGSFTTLPASDVLHFHGPGIHGLMGDNLVARMAKSIALAAAHERFASTYFGNNTVIGGWIEYPRVLGPEAHTQMQKSWEDQHKGPDKAHKAIIMENGAKYHAVDSNAEKAQLIESRQFQLEEICRWYKVPPHKVQHLTRATFNNIEHLGLEWVRDGLTPWAMRLEQEIDFKLFPARGLARRTKLDMAWLTYGDAKSRAEYYKIMREAGAFTINQILEKEGDNPIGDEGDVRIVPLNFQTIKQILIAEENAELALEAAQKLADSPEADDTAPVDPEEDIGETDPNEERGDIEEKSKSAAALREAVALNFASTFARYERRLANRRADLERRQAPEKVESNLASERVALRPQILAESTATVELCRRITGQVLELDAPILLALDEIDNGADPRTVAARLAIRILPATTTERAA